MQTTMQKRCKTDANGMQKGDAKPMQTLCKTDANGMQNGCKENASYTSDNSALTQIQPMQTGCKRDANGMQNGGSSTSTSTSTSTSEKEKENIYIPPLTPPKSGGDVENPVENSEIINIDNSKPEKEAQKAWVDWFYAEYEKRHGRSPEYDGKRIHPRDRQAARKLMRLVANGTSEAELKERIVKALSGQYFKSVPSTLAAAVASLGSYIPANEKKPQQEKARQGKESDLIRRAQECASRNPGCSDGDEPVCQYCPHKRRSTSPDPAGEKRTSGGLKSVGEILKGGIT